MLRCFETDGSVEDDLGQAAVSPALVRVPGPDGG